MMEFIDRTKLKIKMLEKDISKKDLAEYLCLSYQGLYKKLTHMSNFSETEICMLKRKFGKDIFSC